MEEAKALQKRDERDDAKLKVQALALPIAEAVDKTALPRALRLLREIFDSMVGSCDGKRAPELREKLHCLPSLISSSSPPPLHCLPYDDERRLRHRT
jgi:hypothetical protein